MTTQRPSVLITGASHGIGASTARLFARHGYDVILNYHSGKTQNAADKVAANCRKHGGDAWVIQADAATDAGVKRLLDEARLRVGKIDVLINNAARSDEPDFEQLTLDDIQASLAANFVTACLTTLGFMKDGLKEDACVLSVSSIYGLEHGGHTTLPLYSASKAALTNFSHTLAERYAPRRRFNVVVPGYVRTEAWDGFEAEGQELAERTTLAHEWVQADEIAAALWFLASSPHITAQALVVDAGWSKHSNK